MVASDTFFFSDVKHCVTGLPSTRCVTDPGQCYNVSWYAGIDRWVSSAMVREYYKEWGIKQLNSMLNLHGYGPLL